MKVYFFCSPPGPANNIGYEHEIVAIAEGLLELGILPRGNIDYWRSTFNSTDYLIKKSEEVDFNSYDAVVFSSNYLHYSKLQLPIDIFKASRLFKLFFIDSADGLITPGYSSFMRNVDYVLKCHYNNKYFNPSNFVPWQFGLTNRIIKYTQNSDYSFEFRAQEILSNFRVGHTLRDVVESIMKNNFYELFRKNDEIDSFDLVKENQTDFFFWHQTGRRHYPAFYKRLVQTVFSNACGGYMQKSIDLKNSLFFRALKKLDTKLNILKYDRVYQFDSWRFWESLSAGCCTFHVDFEKYGLVLPVMPTNGIHYVGIDLDDPSSALNIIKDEKKVKLITENSRIWVLNYYSPVPVAKRFLSLISSNQIV